MVNGALMLEKNIDYKTIFRKYIIKCIKILIFWNIILAAIVQFDGGTINDVLAVLIYGYKQFWFIYTLIGLYLLQPILRQIIKNEIALNGTVFIFFILIIINTIIQIMPSEIKDVVIHLMSEIGFDELPKWCGYYCLGYYLVNKKWHIKAYQTIISIIVVILSLSYTIIISSYSNMFQLNLIEVFTLSTLIISIFIFNLCKENEGKLNTIKNIFEYINSNLFFIYALHCVIIELLLRLGVSLDLFNMGGLGVIISSGIIIIVLIIIKEVFINRIIILRKFCEW